ncbi:MAG: PAS domain-containing protein [Candidatus Sabulitectum sp.]|nr:PAS domain-containing protein [Candidatus Sabulitectum sp.]
MSETVRELLAKLRISDEPQLSAFLPDPEGQNIILRNLPCALIVLDSDEGVILELNDYALDLFGVQRFTLIGKTLKSVGLSMDANSDSTIASPGNPVRGHIKDSSGVSIPVLLLQRRVRLSGRNADVILSIDSTLIGGSRTAEASFDLFKRALSETKTAYIFASITGGALERDLQVVEVGGGLPDGIREKALSGVSASDVFSPVDAARVVENSIILSRNGGEKTLELKDCRPLKMYADPGGQILIVFPPENEERKTIRAISTQLSSGMRRTVLYIASSASARNSGKEMLEMIGFRVTEMESPSSARIIFDENPGRFNFVVCEEFTDDPDLLDLAGELDDAGIGLVLVTDDEFDYSGDLKVVKVAPPLSINLLASAVSQVSG